MFTVEIANYSKPNGDCTLYSPITNNIHKNISAGPMSLNSISCMFKNTLIKKSNNQKITVKQYNNYFYSPYILFGNIRSLEIII